MVALTCVRLPNRGHPVAAWTPQFRAGRIQTQVAPHAAVHASQLQAQFIARGLHSRDQATRTGDYVEADAVVEALQRKLDAAHKRIGKKRR